MPGPQKGRLPPRRRRRKVRSAPFPPKGENCARSLAPRFQLKPISLGFELEDDGRRGPSQRVVREILVLLRIMQAHKDS